MTGDMSITKKVAASLRVGNGKCPSGHSLMTDDHHFSGERAVVAQASIAGRKALIYINPFYGRHEYKCELALKEGDVVDLTCPTCGASLSIDIVCKLCNVPMFAVHLPDGGQVEACPTIGCQNHALKIVDLDAQLARMYVDETKVQM